MFAQRFAKKLGRRFAGIDADAIGRLRDYPWPGNVRELENTMERAMILASDGQIRADYLQLRTLATPPKSAPTPAAAAGNLTDELDDLERSRLAAALEKHSGRKSDVARELGINRSTLYYRLKKFGFE